ncbi:MAG: hypothetical protein ACHQQQ_13455 [Bacteroidota bacterium]
MEEFITAIDRAQYDNAVTYLRKHLTPRDLSTVKYKSKTNPDWFKEHQFGVGIHIRNILRDRGFHWTDHLDYSEWRNLIEDAVHYGNR